MPDELTSRPSYCSLYEKSRSGKSRGAISVQRYNTNTTHWEAIIIHMLMLPTSGFAGVPPDSMDPQPVNAMA